MAHSDVLNLGKIHAPDLKPGKTTSHGCGIRRQTECNAVGPSETSGGLERRHKVWNSLSPVHAKIEKISFKLAWKFADDDISKVDDLASEVRQTLHAALPRILQKENPWGYAWMIGKNHLIDVYRRAIKHPVIPFSEFADTEGIDEGECIADAGQGKVWATNSRGFLIADAIRTMVQKLPERERQVVRAHFWHGMTFDEMSRAFNVSKMQVREIYTSATRKLRLLLGELSTTRKFDVTPSLQWWERVEAFSEEAKQTS